MGRELLLTRYHPNSFRGGEPRESSLSRSLTPISRRPLTARPKPACSKKIPPGPSSEVALCRLAPSPALWN